MIKETLVLVIFILSYDVIYKYKIKQMRTSEFNFIRDRINYKSIQDLKYILKFFFKKIGACVF